MCRSHSFLSDLIPQDEFIRITGWHRQTLFKRRRQGMPHYKVGQRVFYNPNEVRAWVMKTSRVQYSKRKPGTKSKSKKKATPGRK